MLHEALSVRHQSSMDLDQSSLPCTRSPHDRAMDLCLHTNYGVELPASDLTHAIPNTEHPRFVGIASMGSFVYQSVHRKSPSRALHTVSRKHLPLGFKKSDLFQLDPLFDYPRQPILSISLAV